MADSFALGNHSAPNIMMKKLMALFLTPLFLAIALSVEASTIPLPSGEYQVDYVFDLQLGTLNGSDITDLVIFETDGGSQVSIDYYPYSVPGRGASTISHVIPFDPILALILGLDRTPVGGLGHLVVFMDNVFAADALTKPFYRDVFPAVDGRPRVTEPTLKNAIVGAQLGDAASYQILSDFFLVDAGKYAAFDPENSFRVLEFTAPIAIDTVPEPASLLLLGTGLLAAAGVRRYRRTS